ncbi:hypothetical protein Ngar_c14340 [Candidatus Nitrososphaera gargensis Ga9.2]|uniref:Uncharacterized protein n=1 Tax=Nitrososphaera gargensis (strain Ga9.2) TaxID=1237085 RepID=K0IF18_NITGG|nr:hypothetical protein Ngar_c14340 [Candidatus Nitrososphaera gargensis Ga9.2]
MVKTRGSYGHLKISCWINSEKLVILIGLLFQISLVLLAFHPIAADTQGQTKGTINHATNLSLTGTAIYPAVAASSNNVYVAWTDYFVGNDEILFRKSDDSSATFRNIINLSKNPGSSQRPQIVAAGNYAYVLWNDNTYDGTWNILFKSIRTKILLPSTIQ